MSFAVAQYQNTKFETISPTQLVVEMYTGAIKFLRQAEGAIHNKDLKAKGVALSKAHAIVSELQHTLDKSKSPELCSQLESLYEYVLSQITQANLKVDVKELGPAINILTELREAWAELAKTQL